MTQNPAKAIAKITQYENQIASLQGDENKVEREKVETLLENYLEANGALVSQSERPRHLTDLNAPASNVNGREGIIHSRPERRG